MFTSMTRGEVEAVEFFFEYDEAPAYCKPEVLERMVILRHQAVSPESTLVSGKTYYEDREERPDLLDFLFAAPPFFLLN
ncbi:MAG: hypothetical protein M1482_04425 [Chloroflexi bacterium]|nr:hypothetical protein [Chloroflexota bacterium]